MYDVKLILTQNRQGCEFISAFLQVHVHFGTQTVAYTWSVHCNACRDTQCSVQSRKQGTAYITENGLPYYDQSSIIQ